MIVLRLCALLTCGLAVRAADPIFLGMLEEIPGRYAGESSSRAVRVLFQKNDGAWQPLPSSCEDPGCLKSITSAYPPVVTWNIGFAGRNLGTVTGRTPADFQFYSAIGLQTITGSIPSVGARRREYGGSLEIPVLRPLVANSEPSFDDPDGWKAGRAPLDRIAVARSAFRKKFPVVANCANAHAWNYADVNLKILKSYSSRRGWWLLQIRLDGNRCDGPPEDTFVDQWFAISPQAEAQHLGQGMWLVDAGDYDRDGKSEVVFSIDGYNRGGYRLYSEDFRKLAEFEFSFH